ncbi:MAG: type II toxin-antitoxin system Phd/YefM family antitoxin [Anaerolineales bacterium]
MREAVSVKRTMGATEARNSLGKLLNRVHRGEEHVVIEKLGIPVAAVISMEDYARYRRLLAQEHLRELGRALGREARRQGVTEEELIAEMEEDRRTVYEELYGRES